MTRVSVHVGYGENGLLYVLVQYGFTASPLVRRGDYFEAGMWNGARCEGLLHVSRA